MPQNLQRHQQTREGHFITFSCYRRLPWLRRARARNVFLRVLEKVRRRFDFVVMGFVVMPEHVHLLVSEPRRGRLSAAIQVLKQNSSRELQGRVRRRNPAQSELFREEATADHFWQRRYYDFNVRTVRKRIEKLEVHASESGKARIGAEAGRLALEQLSLVRFRRSGVGGGEHVAEDQSGGVRMIVTHPSKSAQGGAPTVMDGKGWATRREIDYSLLDPVTGLAPTNQYIVNEYQTDARLAPPNGNDFSPPNFVRDSQTPATAGDCIPSLFTSRPCPFGSAQTFGYRVSGTTRRYYVRRIERTVGSGQYCWLAAPVVNIFKQVDQQVLLFGAESPFMGQGNNNIYPNFVVGTSTCTGVHSQ